MYARSEAISRGVLHASRATRSTLGVQSRVQLVPEHPLERLLECPNPLIDMSDLLALSSQWLDATGNAIILKVRNIAGEVCELWPVPALSFQIEKGDDELPLTYIFQPTNTKIAAEDIIHIRRSDLRTAPFYGHAILSDILETAKADSAIRLFQERYFENDAVPRAVLKWPQGSFLTQAQMDDVRNRWEDRYGGPSNGGKIAILPDGGDLQVLSSGTKEFDLRNSKEDLRDQIRAAFKVPKVVLGDVEQVTLANAETSYQVFMRDVVDAALSKICRALTRSLASEWSSDIRITHDNVIPENETHFIGRLDQVKQSLTIDEQRALLALPPLPNKSGNVFLINGTLFDASWRPI
jgi:HK97 family phage portal protein